MTARVSDMTNAPLPSLHVKVYIHSSLLAHFNAGLFAKKGGPGF